MRENQNVLLPENLHLNMTAHTTPILQARPQDHRLPATNRMRIGSVSFLNARPLISGLENNADVELHLEVPSKLLDGLNARRFETALLPVIDYQRLDGLRILPAGGIGSDGETLTVRIFSRGPIDRIRSLACDPDSHTSVALAHILLAERFNARPEFVDLRDAHRDACEAMLLIGDKVVCEAPVGYEHQLDLGQAWKELTGLPFVFAVWMTREPGNLSLLYRTLADAMACGLGEIESIIKTHAEPRGWPADLARQYLTRHLTYSIGERELSAIRKFHQLAHRHGILQHAPKSLEVFSDT